MNRQAINDMATKITGKLQDDLQREVFIAQHILNPHEVTLMMMEVAAGVGAAASLVALQIRRPDTDPGEVFDTFADRIRELTGALKADYLVELAAIEAARLRSVR